MRQPAAPALRQASSALKHPLMCPGYTQKWAADLCTMHAVQCRSFCTIHPPKMARCPNPPDAPSPAMGCSSSACYPRSTPCPHAENPDRRQQHGQPVGDVPHTRAHPPRLHQQRRVHQQQRGLGAPHPHFPIQPWLPCHAQGEPGLGMQEAVSYSGCLLAAIQCHVDQSDAPGCSRPWHMYAEVGADPGQHSSSS